ncbi:MAG: DUF2298 domain-containing protein [Anaerolineales bacterium]|jgi:uncharacterized membrane protein
MMGQIMQAGAWWLASLLIGWLAFPVVRRVFGRLPDQGYGFSRAVGLLGLSYAVWILGTAGWVRNTRAGVFGIALVLGSGCLAWAWRGRSEIWGWLRDRRDTILVEELLFLAAFAVWAFVRANNPDITNTEKPMELMFLNSILRSPTFPPHDSWLSGYAISYYYFGYIMMAVLTRLTGAISGVAFNLTNALWFAMTALGAYSLLYNMLNWRREGSKTRLLAPLLAPLMVVVAGNLEGFLEVLHSQALFWHQAADGSLTSSFWSWLGIKDLVQPPSGTASWIPNRYLWWWRASRVVHDVNLAGADVEVIDEFPFFSFLLADNHPHLLAMPFVLSAIGFAFQSLLAGGKKIFTMSRLTARWDPSRALVSAAMVVVAVVAFVRSVDLARTGSGPAGVVLGVITALLTTAVIIGIVTFFTYWLMGRLPSLLSGREYVFVIWLFGGLAFLNTWDFPIYLSLLMLVLLWRGGKNPRRADLSAAVWTGLAVVLGGVVLYFPWYPSFSSQAGGLLPNLLYATKIQQFGVMFAPALVPILAWLIWKVIQRRRQIAWGRFWAITLGVPVSLLLISWGLAAVMAYALNASAAGLDSVLSSMGAVNVSAAIDRLLAARASHPFTPLLMGLVLAMCAALLWPKALEDEPPPARPAEDRSQPQLFALLMVAIGALLVIGPEFLYLKDLFGDRMNTVFKFYFATWILWGLAGAYAVSEVWPRRRPGWRVVSTLVVVPLMLGLVYPVAAIWTKTNGFDPGGGRTLDGNAYMLRDHPGDAAAIAWINQNLRGGVITEAIGGSYSAFGRVSAQTGLPTVLGWPGHEVQWRGDSALLGSRQDDIGRLYSSRTAGDIQDVLDKYGIAYVYVGTLEQSTYGVGSVEKYVPMMTILYQDQGVTLFGVPGRVQWK